MKEIGSGRHPKGEPTRYLGQEVICDRCRIIIINDRIEANVYFLKSMTLTFDSRNITQTDAHFPAEPVQLSGFWGRGRVSQHPFRQRRRPQEIMSLMEGVKQKQGSKYLLKCLNNEAVSWIDTNYAAGLNESPSLIRHSGMPAGLTRQPPAHWLAPGQSLARFCTVTPLILQVKVELNDTIKNFFVFLCNYLLLRCNLFLFFVHCLSAAKVQFTDLRWSLM